MVLSEMALLDMKVGWVEISSSETFPILADTILYMSFTQTMGLKSAKLCDIRCIFYEGEVGVVYCPKGLTLKNCLT